MVDAPRRWPLRGLVLLLALTAAAPARAAQGEHALEASAHYTGAYVSTAGADHGHGLGLSVGYRYGLTDFFELRVDGGYSALPWTGGELAHLGIVRAGIAYEIDAIEWVPWLGLQAALFLQSGDDPVDGGVAAGFGVDYRPRRSYAVGLAAWYHAMFGQLETIPALVTIGLRVTWYPMTGI